MSGSELAYALVIADCLLAAPLLYWRIRRWWWDRHPGPPIQAIQLFARDIHIGREEPQ